MSCFFRAFQLTAKMGGGGGTPLGPLLGPRPPMINNILGSDYQDYADVSSFFKSFFVFLFLFGLSYDDLQ